MARGFTWLPRSIERYSEQAEALASNVFGASLARSNPFRAAVATYLHAAGIETGYGFFAPAVSDSSKLVFELHYDDGHVEYDLPHVHGAGGSLRVLGLLDYIGQTEYEPLRQVILKMLAYSTWQKHPGAMMVRAVYGYVEEPSLRDAREGAKKSYHFLYAYDFRFRLETATSPTP